MPYIVYASDHPQKDTERESVRLGHRQHLGSAGRALLCAGALLSEDGKKVIGGLSIVNCSGHQAAYDFAHNDPYDKANIRNETHILRWDRSYLASSPEKPDGLEPYVVYTTIPEANRQQATNYNTRHIAYLKGLNKKLLASGFLRDEKQNIIGELTILFAANHTEAMSFINNSPFGLYNLYDSVKTNRWRCRWWEGKFLLDASLLAQPATLNSTAKAPHPSTSSAITRFGNLWQQPTPELMQANVPYARL